MTTTLMLTSIPITLCSQETSSLFEGEVFALPTRTVNLLWEVTTGAVPTTLTVTLLALVDIDGTETVLSVLTEAYFATQETAVVIPFTSIAGRFVKILIQNADNISVSSQLVARPA